MPEGALPSIFTIRPSSRENNWIQVPKQYNDGDRADHGCTITVNLDGNSNRDVFVLVPWDAVREMAQIVIEACTNWLGTGGFITYGVGRTLDALSGPVLYDVDGERIPTPGWVVQPDGSLNAVAVPYGETPGYSKSWSIALCHKFPFCDECNFMKKTHRR